jgi:hypothetical protein
MHSDDSPHWEGAMIADWAAESIYGVRRAAGSRCGRAAVERRRVGEEKVSRIG